MINCPKGQLNTVLFGIVIALASVLVVTAAQDALAQAGGNGGNAAWLFGNGGAGGLADIDIAEAAEAENATMTGATNQTTTNGNMTDVQFLFIQRAQSGSISEINATAYTLELDNVSDSTIMFADRPNRIVTSISTADFVGNWTTGPDSFAADVPNDALIVEDIESGNLETAVIESFSPLYDTNTETLAYTIMAENGTSIELPREFGQTVLVMDDNTVDIYDIANPPPPT